MSSTDKPANTFCRRTRRELLREAGAGRGVDGGGAECVLLVVLNLNEFVYLD